MPRELRCKGSSPAIEEIELGNMRSEFNRRHGRTPGQRNVAAHNHIKFKTFVKGASLWQKSTVLFMPFLKSQRKSQMKSKKRERTGETENNSNPPRGKSPMTRLHPTPDPVQLSEESSAKKVKSQSRKSPFGRTKHPNERASGLANPYFLKHHGRFFPNCPSLAGKRLCKIGTWTSKASNRFTTSMGSPGPLAAFPAGFSFFPRTRPAKT